MLMKFFSLLVSTRSVFCFSNLPRRSYFQMSLPVSTKPLTVGYQGEPGAYSEKAAKELLGKDSIVAVNFASFDDVFKAVAMRDVEYAVVPIENSLGGSIHTNYDLLLRYDLHIIAEYDFRVEHSLLVLPGIKKKDIKKVMSHPQALAQCDNYIRAMGIDREATYDTAGSAKMIKEKQLLDCAAIASDLAGSTYGLDVLEKNIEDDDNNFTRFLLLSRSPVGALMTPAMSAKTSIVFLLPNNPGALYKALACFSLRDIDFSKVESRPTPVKLLQMLQMKTTPSRSTLYNSNRDSSDLSPQDLPRFRYTFYLDFLASEFDDRTQNALLHLQEQSDYVRVLGSYPRGGVLLGPISSTLDAIRKSPLSRSEYIAPNTGNAAVISKKSPLKVGVIGFGKFGQFLAKTFIKHHHVYSVNKADMSIAANEIGCEFFPLYDLSSFAKVEVDVIVLAVSIISFEDVLRLIPNDVLRGKLIVDVLSVKEHPKKIMLQNLPEDCDILCTHPMFGPESGKNGWQGLPFVYEKVRISNDERCMRFLSTWENERCKMIEMTSEQHDEYAASSQFITHLTGRVLWQQNLTPTPIDTNGFKTVLKLVENTCSDSFDLFFGLYYYNKHATNQLQNIREALSRVERQLAAKEAYLAARAEATQDERNRILDECKTLIKEVLMDYRKTKDLPNAIDSLTLNVETTVVSPEESVKKD